MMTYRERYVYYKDHGICVRCGRRSSRPGRVMCFECAVDRADFSKKHRIAKVHKGYNRKWIYRVTDGAGEIRTEGYLEDIAAWCGVSRSEAYRCAAGGRNGVEKKTGYTVSRVRIGGDGG